MDGIRRSGLLVLLAAGIAGAGTGCNGGNDDPHVGKHDIWFMGAVIDGVLNTPLTSADPKTPPYEISLVYGTTTVKGKVDASGRYTLGPLPAWNDYGIVIDATNAGSYRPFSSYNAGIAPPAPPATSQSADIYTADTKQTFDFDAYVFPAAATAPDITVAITESDQPTTAAPTAAGAIRIQPTSQSSIQGKTGEVGMQVWTNSQDLFASAITDTFTAGAYTVMGAKLVYGVNYAVTVYGVDGYQLSSATTFQAGNTAYASIPLTPVTSMPLTLTSTSGTCHTANAPVTTATPIAAVTFTFNGNVVDGTTSVGGDAEILDNSVYVLASSGSIGSTLKTNLSPTVQERGTSLTFSGNTLTIGWTPAVGLANPSPTDTITQVEYSLGSIYVQEPNRPTTRVSLSSLASTLYPNGYVICNQ